MRYLKKYDKYSSLKVLLDDKIKIKINIDDEVKGGKFKNKKLKVKNININDKGDITINNKPFSKFRTNEAFTTDIVYYWKVPSFQPNFEIALTKIGVTNEWISHLNMELDNILMKNFIGVDKYCYVYKHVDLYNYNKYYKWIISSLSFDGIEPDWKYMGEIEVEDWEIKSKKYNL